MRIIGSIFKVALDALLSNKLRSGLTLLGVVIGVTSVMTIISALEGMMGQVEEVMDTLGPTTFMVDRHMGFITSDEQWREVRKRKPIDLKTAEAIEENCTLCEKVSPRTFSGARLKYGSQQLRDVGVMAGTSEFVDIVDFEESIGRFHSAEDDFHRRRVAFIGEDVRVAFFEGLDPLGKQLKVNGIKYTVIGVAKKRGMMFGESQDKYIVIPLSTFVRQFGEPRYGLNVVIKAGSIAQLEECMDEVRVILRSHRNVPYDKPDDFDMLTADSAMDMFNEFTRMFRMVLIGISAISLVIGGIVVMNIMMVSVTERTREIGIRKSLGARRSHIMWQFLFESVTITFTGGLLGIGLGFIIAKVLVGMIDMSIDPSMMAIFSGLIVSGGIGLVSGVYPAMKAARLDPVKALSYE